MRRPELTGAELLDIGLDVIYQNLPDGVTLTLREIADICGVDPKTVWTLEYRTLQKLKQEYTQR